ncbi:uncharacterized protein LOC141691455 [Apium graveolens]|uniref:uncharacterized protein LOC141691455 n=1 Tax=Apium graveolens TaxID=4045 RepID=UPI003D7BE341
MGKDFVWTPDREEAFLKIKEQLGNPPMLAKPEEGETLILYLAVSEYSVNAVLVKDEGVTNRPSIKGQALADFILEFDSEVDDKAIVLIEPSLQGNPRVDMREEFPHPWWILHIDGAVNNNGAGAGPVLIENSLKVRVVKLIARSDSELVVNQVNGGFQAQGPRIELYMRCVQRLLEKFGSARLEGVPREENSNADALAKLGSQMDSVQRGQIPLGIQEIPSIPEVGVFQTQEISQENWMTPIHNYIRMGGFPGDKL